MKRQLGLSEMVRRRTARAARRATRGAFGLWVWSNDGDLRSSMRRGRETRTGRATGSGDPRRARSRRRGSTLLVVMALLGMLLLLGMLYFTFATQEQHNATNFAESVKQVDDQPDDIEAIFDSVLEQLVQGPSYDKKNSALWGGRHSFAFSMLGQDLQPFNGVGVNVHWETSGGLVVDQNRDGTADADQSLLELNDSPGARSVWPPVERRVETFPAPDVDYTYPDHNNAWLAYIGTTWKTPSNAAPTGYPVIKPSFHRPELLRDDSGMPLTNWATHTGSGGAPFSTAGRLFRPHPNHLYVPRSDQNITTPIRRFLNDYDPADTSDIASLSPSFAPSAPRGFPFKNVPPLPAAVPASAPDRKQGVWSLTTLPPNPPFTFPAHEFDVDNDNDGTPDSIWMDLDLPVMVRPSDNATYVPLIGVLIQDLDSLLNLNAVGNLSGDTRTLATSDFGNGGDISQSSMGLSPSEINPLWAMDTLPSQAASLTDHTSYFHAPATMRHLANMEWWWFNKGRVEYTTPRQIHAGRYGEANRVWGVLSAAGGGSAISVQMSNSNLFPFPGIWDADDNRDSNEGGTIIAGANVGGQALPFGHPLAINGWGRYWTANPKKLDLFQALGAADPNQWLRYTDMGVGYDGSTGAGNVAWVNPFGGALMVNSIVGAGFSVPGSPATLVDDPTEMTLIPKYLQRPYDEPLDAKDALLLFMNPSDRNRTGITSRVLDLMPGNISPTASSNFYQLQVAKRFTTESWDVKQFGLPRFIGGVGTDGAAGIAGKDDNRDGVSDDENERGWPGSDDDRAWEYNVDIDGNGLLEFPPQFNPASDFQPRLDSTAADYRPENAYGPNDPFRPQLRRLLSIEFGNTRTPRTPMRLNINEFLDVEHRAGTVSDPITDPLVYRPLTAHSTDSTLTTVSKRYGLDLQPGIAGTDDNNDGVVDDPNEMGATGSDDPQFPPTTEVDREFWARRDRQQMARDIYVLLYTFCGGNDMTNLATTVGDTAYSGKVRRQMAQFAVNYVDALDRDNVITAFEYDDNLADGWDLDDDFTTNDGANPATGLLASGTSRRFVVFGVEAQELTISEALWASQSQNAMDHPLTPFNETLGEHQFLQVELRCVSPNAVTLFDNGSTALNKAIWRLVRDDNGNGTMDATENAAQFLKGTFNSVPLGPSAAPPSSLSPGALFTFASAGAPAAASASPGQASLYVDTNAAAGFELAAPNLAGSFPTSPGYADLDMNHSAHASFVALEQAGSVPGDLLSKNYDATSTPTTIRLERRLNPKLISLNQAMNPFQSIDQFSVQKRTLNIIATDTTPALAAAKVAVVTSQERDQPLNGASSGNSTGSAPAALKSTLMLKNSNNPVKFDIFQPHFDRDFPSVIDLFDIPLEGPERSTSVLIDSRRPPNLVDSGGTGIGQLENRGPFTFGAAVLMQSEDANGDDDPIPLATDDANNNGFKDGAEIDTNGNGYFDFGEDFNKNGIMDAHPYHFHRLLSLVEVATRTHRQLGDPLKVNRVPGKINLNGVRDPRVLAGLIDERQVMGPPERTGVDIDGDGVIETGLQDLLGDQVQDAAGNNVNRDWWFQFLIARDGLDPTTSLPLPISGLSRPFRDLGTLRYDQDPLFSVQSSIEETILRELPGSTKYTRTQGKAKGKGKGKAKGKTGGGSGTAGPADGRRLFELATEAEFTAAPTSATALEPMMRYRLLSKIAGNTTTRSNVFVVQATVGMFACKELSNGAVRIGGQMDVDKNGTPDSHRAIFIIDRSAIEDAYDKGSRTFDWKKLVNARQRIN